MPRGTALEIHWSDLLEEVARSTGFECHLVDSSGKLIAKAGEVPAACALVCQHNGECSQKELLDCLGLRSGVHDGVLTCAAGASRFLFPLLAGERTVGQLYCGGFRLQLGDGRQPGETTLSADINGVDGAMLAEAQHRLPPIPDSDLERQLQLVRSSVSNAVTKKLGPTIANLIRDVEEVESAGLWERIATAFQLLLPGGSEVEIFTTLPHGHPLTRMHPDMREADESEPGRDLPLDHSKGHCQNEHGVLLLRLRSQRQLLGYVRLVSATRQPLADGAVQHLSDLAHRVADALLLRRENEAHRLLKELEPTLSRIAEHEERLREILDFCCKYLGCDDGDVALVTPDDEGHLTVFARRGEGTNELPHKIPSQRGITGRALRKREATVVANTREDADFVELVNDPSTYPRYVEYSKKIEACAKFPLFLGSEALGVLSIYRHSAGPFNLGRIRVVEHLTKRVEVEAACVLAREQLSIQARRRREDFLTPEAIAANLQQLGPGKVRQDLMKQLCETAREMTGAYRTAVCVIDTDYSKVSVTAYGDWPEDKKDRTFEIPLTHKQSAVITCIKRGDTYLCEDVREPEAFYLRTEPDETGSTVTIPLRYGTHLLGTLAVEWKPTGACKPPLVYNLEALCDRYAEVINRTNVDHQMRQLEAILRQAGADADQGEVYEHFLDTVAQMLGVLQGGLFLRENRTGRYQLVASLARKDLVGLADSYYEPGQGVTGWILKHNREISIDNLRDPTELSKIAPPVEWMNRIHDDQDSSTRHNAYLGVPVSSMGGEVFGVLRFNAPTELRHFDRVDLHIAKAAADRLAAKLYQFAEAKRADAKLRLSTSIPGTTSLCEMSERVFQALDLGLGPGVAGHIRLVDRLQEADQSPEEVLLLHYHREPPWAQELSWQRPALTQKSGQDASGWVWEHGTTFHDPDSRATGSKCRQIGTPAFFCEKIGSVIVLSLRATELEAGTVLGTLHVYKEHRRSFSGTDVEFLEQLAGIAADGLASVKKAEDSALELEIEKASDDFLVGVLKKVGDQTHDDLQRREKDLLLRILRALQTGMSGKQCWLLLPNSNGNELIVHNGDGEPILEVQSSEVAPSRRLSGITPQLFRKWLRGKPLRVAYRLDKDFQFKEWLGELRPLFLDLAKEQFCILSLESDKKLLAAFMIRVESPGVVSHRRAELALERLNAIAEYILLARQVRDARIAEPLVLLGAFASSFEHETRRPLSHMLGALDELCGRNPDEERKLRLMTIIQAERDRLDSLHRKLNSIVGSAREPRRVCNLRDPLDAALNATRSSVCPCELVFLPPTRPIHIRGTPDLLEQAFLFIIKNACDAVSSLGTNGQVTVSLDTDEQSATIVVSDNGPPVSDSILQGMLQPFFTTKPEGSGLGLKAAYSVVRFHQGDLRIERNTSTGLRVVVSLPLESHGVVK